MKRSGGHLSKPEAKVNRLRVWYDACTGKHIRYGTAIGQRLRKAGHEFIFTTREHLDTLPLAKMLGENPVVVGKYDPATLCSRLQASAERIIAFSKMFQDNLPDVAIAHQSVELCRTAFGLGVPIVLTADTPYANAVNRLTIPFAHTVIVSEALPKSFARQHCAKNILTYRGVDEVAWIKDFKPTKISGLKKPLIVIRQIESKAAYAGGKKDATQVLVKKLAELGHVHFIGRYDGGGFGSKEGFVDSKNLVANADLVIGYGGTIGREAALQGVPSIGIGDMAKTNVNRYLAQRGFPYFVTTEHGVLDYAKRYLGKRFNVQDKLAALENPVDIIEKVVNSLKPN
jgi:predicted glycosyltransferase